jgi:hypothetical protein
MEWVSTGVGSSLVCKYHNRVVAAGSDKHTSLQYFHHNKAYSDSTILSTGNLSMAIENVTLSIRTLSIWSCYAKRCYVLGLFCMVFIVMLSVATLNPVVQSVVMLNVAMPSILMLIVVMRNVIMLNVIMANIVIKSVAMLNDVKHKWIVSPCF